MAASAALHPRSVETANLWLIKVDWRGAGNHTDGGLKAAESKVAVNKSSGGGRGVFRDLPSAAAAKHNHKTLQRFFSLSRFVFKPGLNLVS